MIESFGNIFIDILGISDVSSWIKVYALVLSIIGAIKSTPKLIQLWNTRNLRKVWGISNREHVLVICSELDDAEIRQNCEPREFIYSLKYGDVDAYFEVVVTLLRLYPKIKLRILSSGEAENTKIDMSQTVILIGGPDYNMVSADILSKNITKMTYRSPYFNELCEGNTEEISVYDKKEKKEYYELTDKKDFGYFERINNPYNKKKKIILIGGCHTLGVTSAVKAFSLSLSEHGEIPNTVLNNSKTVAKIINKKSEFTVVVNGERVGQSIYTPVIRKEQVRISTQ